MEAFDHMVGRRDVRSGPYVWLIRSNVLLRAGNRDAAREWARRALDASRCYDDPGAPSIVQATAALRAAE